jgi:anion-transporting  ArsA/GET3 family ATPase
VLNKLLGTQVLTDVGTFISAIDTTFGGFRERADKTYALLKEPSSRFVVIAAPEPDALREAAYFVERLKTDTMPLAGLVLYRVQYIDVPELSADRARVASESLSREGRDLTAALLGIHANRQAQAERQQHLAERFTAAHPAVTIAMMPAMAEDIHDLAGLRAIGDRLAES